LQIAIEPLGRHHDRAAFSCGHRDLDDWFRHRAGQDEKRNVARVFVAVDAALGVIGFYSLSAFTLATSDIPQDVARKLPRYDVIPAALIGRLARDERMRGQGVGELLHAARTIAVFAIVVDVKDKRAAEFYGAFGFLPFPLTPKRMFLLSATALAGLEKT
jgi:GNAT superfamily N-acetyltransferase